MSKRAAKSVLDKSQKRQRVDSLNGDSSLEVDDDTNETKVGKILSITLKNFMNHDNLKFDFSPHINIIIGRNGSGKSAVVSGILLALGGKSNLTGRYSSLRGYVKNGKQSALLAVTLSNEGTSPYKPEIYGPKIIVERIITSDGSGSYKIKSHAGQIIATSKEELNKVLDCMKIQVDNPVSILTQENSRCFLDSKNAKDKYKFFFKATQLERLYGNYVDTDQNLKNTEQALKPLQEGLTDKEKEIKNWEIFMEKASKIPEYENELVWSQVIEMEKKQDSEKKEYDVSERRVKSSEEKLKQSMEKYDKCCASLDEVKEKLSEYKKDVDELKKDISELEIQMRKINEQKMELKGKITKVKREIMKNNDEIQNLQRSINETREKSQQDLNEEKRKREENISKLQQNMQMLNQEAGVLSVQQNQLAEGINDGERKIQKLEYQEKEFMKQQNSASIELQTLKNSVQDPVNIFGSYMQDLLNTIDDAARKGHFKRKPIGPIARFVQVTNKKWTFAIEFLLGNALLKSFCCDNFEDRDKLTKMIQRYQPTNSRNPQQGHQIIVSEFLTQVHNVQKYKVQSHYSTVLDFIECTDAVVMNCLIDQRSIESVLLIEQSSEAIDLMMKNPPYNCRSTYLPNGDQIYPSPKYRYYSCKARSNYLLQSVRQDDIRYQQEQYENLRVKRTGKIEEIQVEKEKLFKQKKDFDFIKGKLKNVHRSIQFCQEQIEDLQVVEELKDVHLLQEDLVNQYAERERLQKQNDELVQYHDSESSTFEDLGEKMKIKKQQYKEKATIYVNFQDRRPELEGSKENFFSEKTACENAVQREKGKMVLIKKSYEEAKKDAETCANNAERICTRIESSRSPQVIEALIEETKKIIKENSKCENKDMNAKYSEKQKQLKQDKEKIERLTNLIENLLIMVNKRFGDFDSVLGSTESILHYEFVPLLQSNKYLGKMTFCHAKNTLTIHAIPSEESSKLKQSTKDLSGGERSFVQICFLLALWRSVEMPFRILDEYDVFMDSVNRQLSFDLILDVALKDTKTQHIFFSPLELPRMKESELIAIRHMPDPKRIGDS